MPAGRAVVTCGLYTGTLAIMFGGVIDVGVGVYTV